MAIIFTVIGTGKVYKRRNQTNRMENKVDELKAKRDTSIVKVEDTGDMEMESEDSIVILPDYREIYNQNTDLIGWLYIPGTQIDYPVMQRRGDNEYYLNHDFDNNININGALMLDGDNDIEKDINLIIHGHNMKSGAMFGGLDLFKDQDYYKERPNIYFDTLYEKRTYEIIGLVASQVYRKSDKVFKYYQFRNPNSKEEFDKFRSFIEEGNLLNKEIDIEYGDKFISLSTCSYHIENGRLVLIGKLIP